MPIPFPIIINGQVSIIVLTGVIAFATCVYVVISFLQWQALRTDLTLQFRPYLKFRIAKMGEPKLIESDVLSGYEVLFILKNVGSAIARNILIQISTYAIDDHDLEKPLQVLTTQKQGLVPTDKLFLNRIFDSGKTNFTLPFLLTITIDYSGIGRKKYEYGCLYRYIPKDNSFSREDFYAD